jgi:Mechanosensitive ion channel, conserved TM helix
MNPIVAVTGFWDAFVTKIAVFLPNLFFSIAILLLGWVICNVIKRIVVRLLKLCQFDALAERAGIKQVLERGGIRQAPSDIIGLLTFWFLFLIAIVTTLETLNLSGATDTLHTIYLYIPKIAAALVTLILGLYFANFLETVTRTSCANAGLDAAASIGRAAYIGTTIFVVAGIFEILDIASEIVIWAFILVFGAVCLALALAFGLGGREVAARYLEKWLEQRKNE